MFGGGSGASLYEAMFDQHLSERLAGDSPLGIADLLESRWLENRDVADKPDAGPPSGPRNPGPEPIGAQVGGRNADH